jgi:hypothetical protein
MIIDDVYLSDPTDGTANSTTASAAAAAAASYILDTWICCLRSS